MQKPLKPTPHGVIDYVWAGAMIAAPWLFGFSKNKAATIHCVASGAGILGLSLATRYPLGAAKTIPFGVHGAIETTAGLNTALAPWTMGFAEDRAAKITHVVSGLSTLAVVALTDYGAADGRPNQGLVETLAEETAGMRGQIQAPEDGGATERRTRTRRKAS